MPYSSSESERLTRKKRIDRQLKALGWTVFPYHERAILSQMHHDAIEEYPLPTAPLTIALVVDGQLVGVVEAKKL